MFEIRDYKHLNPKLWTPIHELRPDAEEILKRIFLSVMSVLSLYSGLPMDVEKDIESVLLCGSNLDYFYTKHSDLDLKIVIRPDRYLEKMDLDTFYSLTTLVRNFFFERYNPKLKGMPIDIGFVSPQQNEKVKNAKYFLHQRMWLNKNIRPKKSEVKYLKHRSKLILKAMKKQIYPLIRNESTYEEASRAIAWFKNRRGRSWQEKWKNRSPYTLAYSQLSRSRKIQKFYKKQKVKARRLVFDIKTNPA